MKTMTIHFTSGKLLSLNMPAQTADETIARMNIDPTGTTLITNDNGNAYLINRAQMTHVTVAA